MNCFCISAADEVIDENTPGLHGSDGDSDRSIYDQWGENSGDPYSPRMGGQPRTTKKKQHRTAANQRERKRMKSINDAFDNLRQYIPLSESERSKLSKVDTLKYAIMYIGNMTELLQQYEDTLYYRKKKHSESPKSISVCSKVERTGRCAGVDDSSFKSLLIIT